MNIDLTGKNAMVGGGSKGIGLASAQELARLGANVTLVSRSPDSLESALRTLDSSKGQKHSIISADYSNPSEAIQAVKDGFDGHPHILVHNSGGPPAGPVIELSVDDYRKGFESHFTTTHEITKWALPFMESEGYGRIVNVLSVSVKQPINELPVSNMIRAGIANWSKTLANSVGQHGITVNNVLPGYTLTERMIYLNEKRAEAQNITVDEVKNNMANLVPAKRFAEPKEVGSVVAFLSSPAASYINGVSLPVDGGLIKGYS